MLLAEDAEDLFGQRARHELDRVEEHVAIDLRLGIGTGTKRDEGFVQRRRNAPADAGRLIEHRRHE